MKWISSHSHMHALFKAQEDDLDTDRLQIIKQCLFCITFTQCSLKELHEWFGNLLHERFGNLLHERFW